MLPNSWKRKAGVELTRIVPEFLLSADDAPEHIKADASRLHPDWEHDRRRYIHHSWLSPLVDQCINKLNRQGKVLVNKNKDVILRYGTDPGCVEIPSTPINTIAHLSKFFHVVDEFGEQNGLLRFSETICGTGGHIHVGINGAYEAARIKRLVLNHPELLLAFAHPDDDQHYCEHQSAENVNHGVFVDDWGDVCNLNIYNANDIEGDKSTAVSYRPHYNTVEFRMFDVAQTWEMQEEHMTFAQAFVQYALSGEAKMEKLYTIEDVQSISVEQSMKAFERMIHTLHLPWKRYMDYVDNIKLRYEWKTLPSFLWA